MPGLTQSPSQRVDLYLGYFQLKEAPFSITPDPQFLYLSHTHRQVIEKIMYGINSGQGFLLLTGEVGTGKTTLCRSILDQLTGRADTVYIINPSISGQELIANILDDLAVEYPPDAPKKKLIDILNHYLLNKTSSQPTVIIIDDAQTMSMETLEDLRLLSNLETDKIKLLQVIIVGQPELLEMISHPRMRQLQQRIVMNCRLDDLSRNEMSAYIARRLFIAGDTGLVHFTTAAVKLIHRAAHGIPRLINKICDYALIAGYVTDQSTIGPKQVKQALAELGSWGLASNTPLIRRIASNAGLSTRWLATCAAACLLLCGALSMYLFGFDQPFAFPQQQAQTMAHPNMATAPVSHPPAITPEAYSSSQKQPAAPANRPPSTPVQEVSTPANTYALQLGSFRTLDLTLRACAIYRKRGLTAHWQLVETSTGDTLFRVFSGRFATVAEARQFKDSFGFKDAIIKSFPWTVAIAEAGSPTALEPRRDLLKRHEQGSYITQVDGTTYRLESGIFKTQEDAESFVRQLSQLGLTGKIISRRKTDTD